MYWIIIMCVYKYINNNDNDIKKEKIKKYVLGGG